MQFNEKLDDIQIFTKKTHLDANVIPNTQGLYFIAKYQELMERYYLARVYLCEIDTPDWDHWIKNNSEEMKKFAKIRLQASFYETALIYYNIVVDLSWILVYASLETFVWSDEVAKEAFGFKSKEEAQNILRHLEKDVGTPLTDDNQLNYLKKVDTEYGSKYRYVIEYVETFWKNIKDSSVRSNYNFIKHRGRLAYKEVVDLNYKQPVRIFLENKDGSKVPMPDCVNDVQKTTSLHDCIEEMKNFDDEILFPYIKNLVEQLDVIVKPSPVFDIQHRSKKMASLISDKFKEWEAECNTRFTQLKANEEELNRIFIDIYGLQDELTPEVEDKDVTVRKADLQRDIKSLLSYAVGCMFGRYSLDVEGLAFAGGTWDESKYVTFKPDEDNVIPITDEDYFEDDIIGRLIAWLKVVYGAETLEENLRFIADALGTSGDTARQKIRNYFLKDFFKDHCKIYQKRPIYWLYDSGKQNGFKALIYMHRYNADTSGQVRAEYLGKMEETYESEINRMQDIMDNGAGREVALAGKRKEKLQKQLHECRDYDAVLGHIALASIAIDLDDGVKVNYVKVQTAKDGKLLPILAKI